MNSVNIPATMSAVLLKGHGGFEQLELCNDVPVPKAGPSEVLIQVKAAGINNTDINTRIGWYSKSVSKDTHSIASSNSDGVNKNDASWAGKSLQFPLIQGADCCGIIVSVGNNVSKNRIGERVLVRPMMRSFVDDEPWQCWTLGSEYDGSFAQYIKAPAVEVHKIECCWSDAELATIPCAYSTAENMLHRGKVGAETVFVTGASGGVGSAVVQLAKRRGATIIAQAAQNKHADLEHLGITKIIDRNDNIVETLGDSSVDVVIDLVAGSQWGQLLKVLKRGGRYITAGAIAGPLVELDVRTLYLKDLSLLGCTFQEDIVFKNLIQYIEAGEIKPLLAKTYPLREIVQAQKDFINKKYTGKLALIP